MANVPAAGFPSRFSRPGSGALTVRLVGFDEAEEALLTAALTVPAAYRVGLTEVGLFGEAETKVRTPVQFGVLRASIGHYDPGEVDPTGPEGAGRPGDAHFATHVQPSKNMAWVEWGTNVEYAPWIEHGFTVATRRLVHIHGVGFRWVDPFSYRGAHMFELGLEATARVATRILEPHIAAGLAGAGAL